MNQVKSRAFQTGVIVWTLHMLFEYQKFALSKTFREFNFLCRLDQQQYLNAETLQYFDFNCVTGRPGVTGGSTQIATIN